MENGGLGNCVKIFYWWRLWRDLFRLRVLFVVLNSFNLIEGVQKNWKMLMEKSQITQIPSTSLQIPQTSTLVLIHSRANLESFTCQELNWNFIVQRYWSHDTRIFPISKIGMKHANNRDQYPSAMPLVSHREPNTIVWRFAKLWENVVSGHQ